MRWLAVARLLGLPVVLFLRVGVVCTVCFLLSILAFLLALIPPVRLLLERLLARRFLVLGGLVTLVALFYAVENWRGRRAWQSFRQAHEAKGERFDWTGVVAPPVPSDQNFFETPLWNDLHFVRTNDVTVWSDKDWQSRVVFSVYGPMHQGRAPDFGAWPKAEPVDLAAWQAFYRGSNNVFSVPGGPSTNYFPVAQAPQAPAADVLLALSRFEANRRLLAAAAARPHSRFWANYEAGFGTLLPHLQRVKSAAQYLSLHANAALKAGDRQTALEDVRLIFRLMESVRGEPFLISHLVRVAMLQLALQPAWEGLAGRQWSEADLRTIEGSLASVDFLADYHLAIRGERACTLWAVDYVRKRGALGLNELGVDRGGVGPAGWEEGARVVVVALIPAGWYDQNKLSICRLHERYFLPVVDRERRIVAPAVVRRSEAALLKQAPRPYDAFSQIFLPSVTVARRFAVAQTWVDQASLACALERFRLANGQFPEGLDALAPGFLRELPHDLINGQPLKYRRTDDGQFVIYSAGWNEADDGGNAAFTKGGNLDWNKGDWVWRYPAR